MVNRGEDDMDEVWATMITLSKQEGFVQLTVKVGRLLVTEAPETFCGNPLIMVLELPATGVPVLLDMV